VHQGINPGKDPRFHILLSGIVLFILNSEQLDNSRSIPKTGKPEIWRTEIATSSGRILLQDAGAIENNSHIVIQVPNRFIISVIGSVNIEDGRFGY